MGQGGRPLNFLKGVKDGVRGLEFWVYRMNIGIYICQFDESRSVACIKYDLYVQNSYVSRI